MLLSDIVGTYLYSKTVIMHSRRNQTLLGLYSIVVERSNIGFRYFTIAIKPMINSKRPAIMIATPKTAALWLLATNRKIRIHKAPMRTITDAKTITWNPRRLQNEENSRLVLTSVPSIKSRCFPAPLVKERAL